MQTLRHLWIVVLKGIISEISGVLFNPKIIDKWAYKFCLTVYLHQKFIPKSVQILIFYSKSVHVNPVCIHY